MFKHQRPEETEAPTPPSMAGHPVFNTKLNALRLRQLYDLAKAFEIPYPDGATKDQMLPIMVSAEQAGIFRTKPKNYYHFVHAKLNHDDKLSRLQQEDMDKELQQALKEELRKTMGANEKRRQAVEDAKKDPDSIYSLQQRAKSLGIMSYSMSRSELLAAIESKENERAIEAEKQAMAELAENS